ncbi:MAG: hypothetical protein ACI9OJ_002221, partial [Myxococcota bacterium]
GLCDQAFLKYSVAGNAFTSDSVALTNGSATIEITVSNDLADALPVDVSAVVVSSNFQSRTNETSTETYTVDVAKPEPVLSGLTNGMTIGFGADADQDPENGIQLSVAGTVTGLAPNDTDSIEVTSSDGQSVKVTPSGASAPYAWKAELTFDGNLADASVSATATDACGNSETITVDNLTIVTGQATLQIITPGAGAKLWAIDDKDSGTPFNYETDVLVETSDLSVPTTLSVQCGENVAGGAPKAVVGSLEVTEANVSGDGTYQIEIAINTSGGKTAWSCNVTDSSINSSVSTAINITVALPAPAFQIQSPTGTDPTNAAVISLSGGAVNLDGQTAQVTVKSLAADVFTIDVPAVAGGGFQWAIPMTVDGQAGSEALADGMYELAVTIADALGNNPCVQAGSVCSTSIALDRTGPIPEITAPVQASIDPDDDPDTGAGPGFQTLVTVSVGSDEVGTEICIDNSGAGEMCATVAAGDTAVTFPEVTLQPGDNTISATATDLAGNESEIASKVVNLISDAPIVSVTQPSGNTSTATTTIDVVVQVNNVNGSPEMAADVSILVDGADSGAVGVHNGAGEYAFTAVPLGTFGNHQVAAAASINGGPSGVSSAVNVNAKDGTPTATITNVTDGATFNLASAECALGQTDCSLSVSCTTFNVDDGSSATLNWNCGAGIQSVASTVESDAAVFDSVVLTNNSTCSLSCVATDAGTGQVATSSTNTAAVDRTKPVFGAYVKPANNSLIFVDDESSGTDGFQYSVQLRVSGVEQGQIITLSAQVQGGASTSQQQAIPNTIPVGQFETIYFGSQTYPQGIVTFSATVSDNAGNVADPLDKVVEIVSEQPLIRISQPSFSAAPCSSDVDCGAGELCLVSPNGQRCGLGWGVNSDTSLLIKTQNLPTLAQNEVRVCSDNPAYAGNMPCDASGAGYRVVVSITTSGDDHFVDLGVAVEGIHNFVAEAKLNDDGTLWVSSTGASTLEDQLRTVKVDVDVPTMNALASPDDVDPAGCLNVAEGNGSYDISATCNQDGTIALFNGPQQIGTQASVAGVATAFLNVALPESLGLSLTAVCTDSVGNSSVAIQYDVSVDVTNPTLGFTQPTAATLLAGADLDVILTSDEVNAFVSLTDSQNGAVGSAIVQVDQLSLFPHVTYGTLSEGAHVLSAAVADACGNSASAQAEVTVDTIAPTATITAPANAAQLVDADDADAAGGFQVNVTASAGGDATSWSLSLEAGCNSDFSTCGEINPVAGGALADGDSIAAQLVTVPIFETPDFIRFTLTVSDDAGNTVSTTSQIQITLSSCSLAFEGLPSSGYVNNALCPTAGSDCADIEQTFTVRLVGACGAITNVDLLEGGAVSESVAVSGATATFTRTFTHGEQVSLEGQGQGSALSTGAKTYDVDLSDPVPAFTATTIGAFTTPASGTTANWNAASDTGAAAGMQVSLRVDVADTGLGDGQITALTAIDGGSETALVANPTIPLDISGASFGVDLTGITVPEGSGVTVRVTSNDKAGNSAESTFTYNADSATPGPVTLAIDGTNRRRPSITVSWTAPADNGATGEAVASYQIRYSRDAITQSSFATACDASSINGASAYPIPAAAGGAESYTISGPDQRDPTDPCHFVVRSSASPYYVAVRAIDAAGNPGDVQVASVVNTSDLALRYAKLGIAGDLADSDFDKRISAIGDVNNDGFADFLVGGNTSNGVCIFYGSDQATVPELVVSPVAGTTEAGANWQCLLDKDEFGVLQEQRSGHISRNVGDVNGDGLQDFAIPSGRAGSWPEPAQVRIYFGVDGGQVSGTPSVVITNYAPDETSTTSRFDGGGNFNGDTNDHDNNAETPPVAVSDIVLGSRRKFCNPDCDGGRAFVVPGNPNWTAGTVIDFAVPADLVTHNVITFVIPTVPTGIDPRFGAQAHFVGDLLPDVGVSYDDIVVTIDDPVDNTRAVILRGRPLSGATVSTVSYAHDGSGDEDSTSVELLADDGQNNFGANSNVTGADVNGDGLNEVMIGHTKNTVTFKRLYIFDGQAIRDAEGDTLIMGVPILGDNSIDQDAIGDGVYVSPVGAGSIIVGSLADIAFVGDVSDQGNGPGIHAIGYRETTDPGKAYVRYNTSSTAIGFGLYPYADLVFGDPFTPNDPLFNGRDIRGIGDFNGDGLWDFVVGTNGSGYSVLVY